MGTGGDREMGRQAIGRWGDGAIARWGDGDREMGNGEMGKGERKTIFSFLIFSDLSPVMT